MPPRSWAPGSRLRHRKSLPRVSETALVDATLRYLGAQGCLVFRQNTGMMQVHAQGRQSRYIRFGGLVGCSDVLGCTKDGRFLAVELKRPGNEPTWAQQRFLEDVRAHGGMGWVVHSVEELMAAWETRGQGSSSAMAASVDLLARLERAEAVVRVAKSMSTVFERWAEDHHREDGECRECGVPYEECTYQRCQEMVEALTAWNVSTKEAPQ